MPSSSPCECCSAPLNESWYNDAETRKSCPNCSRLDGHQHVFWDYPAAFGESEARASQPDPDGAQSWCRRCRLEEPPPRGTGIACRDKNRPPAKPIKVQRRQRP